MPLESRSLKVLNPKPVEIEVAGERQAEKLYAPLAL
jgi:hypothetical protein